MGEVRVDAQSLPKVLDRLSPLALLRERSTPVGVGFGRVRLDLQGLPVVLDRLGQLPLIIEQQTPVVVG